MKNYVEKINLILVNRLYKLQDINIFLFMIHIFYKLEVDSLLIWI